VLTAVVIVVVPFALLSVSLAHEAAGLLALVQSGESGVVPYLRGVFDALPGWAAALLQRFGLVDFATLQRWLNTWLELGSGLIAGQALSLGQNTFEFAASLFIAPYLAFFLVRDGDRIVHAMRRALPLTPVHKQELLKKFSPEIRSTVMGNLVVAAIQGALGGLAFWFLGLRAALLWAVVMAFLSLLPAIGAALVWLPVAIWLLVTGALWQSVALVAWGALVIGLVDNLLRPMIVGKATLMPDYVEMITTLGGMVVFGIHGFVLGPVIAAMFFAAWHLVPDDAAGRDALVGPSETLTPGRNRRVQGEFVVSNFTRVCRAHALAALTKPLARRRRRLRPPRQSLALCRVRGVRARRSRTPAWASFPYW
jgi:predicted PurR-regulated permease PerM